MYTIYNIVYFIRILYIPVYRQSTHKHVATHNLYSRTVFPLLPRRQYTYTDAALALAGGADVFAAFSQSIVAYLTGRAAANFSYIKLTAILVGIH